MSEEILFRLLVPTFMMAGIVVSIFFRHRADRMGGRVSRRVDGRRFVSLQLLFVFSLPAIVLLYAIEPSWIAALRLPLPSWARWLGLLVAAACIPCIGWLLRHLGANITPTAAVRDRHQLVTSGPYRYIRHPLYTFGTLWWLGLSLAVASWWMLLFTMVTFLAVAARTREEERALVDRFGDDYRHYMRQTPRYLPRLSFGD